MQKLTPVDRHKNVGKGAKPSPIRLRAPFWRRPWFLTLGVIVVFCLLSLAAYWPIVPGSSSRLPGCACGDAVQSVWFLRWVPYAISHGHNPFYTTWLNVPYGANLAQNTLMPLLGLLAAPITALASPVASFNFLAWLAFPISATSMFYVARRLTGSYRSAFVAGLLYGFSPYMAGQGGGHIMLTFVPLPPLILLAVWELLIQQQRRPALLGGLLAAEVIAQFLIDPEVLAIALIVAILGTALLIVTSTQLVTRSRIIYTGRTLAVTAIVSGVVLIYPIWFMVFGPNHFSGPNFAPGNPYRSDLIGLVTPTLNEKFVPGGVQRFASQTAGGDYPETGDYVGIALLVVVGAAAIRWRRNRWLLFGVILTFGCWLLSLGPRLVIDGHKTILIFPFAVLTKIPLLQDLIPSRLALAEWLVMPLVVALILSEWRRERAAGKHSRRAVAHLGFILVAIAVVVTLLPRWPYHSQKITVPPLFASHNHTISDGSIMLAYPFPLYPTDQAMLWQATSNMRFKLLGAYIQNPSSRGTETEFPPLLQPPAVEEWLGYEQDPAYTPWLHLQSVTLTDVRTYLGNYHVSVVAVDPGTVHARAVTQVFTAALGPPEPVGGMLVWAHVQARLRLSTSLLGEGVERGSGNLVKGL